MKKKMLIVSLFAVFLMVSVNMVSAVNTQIDERNVIPEEYFTVCFDDPDNPGGWVTNTMDYVSIIFGDIQYIASNFGIGRDIFSAISDTFQLIKNLRDAERFIELVTIIINDFIPLVQQMASLAQRTLGLIQVVSELLEMIPEFIDYIGSQPWTAPVIIRGIISGPDGALVANVVCNEASQETGEDGVYNLEVASVNDYIPATYSVTASANDFSSETKSTIVFPDGVVTVDFVLEADDVSHVVLKYKNLISNYFGGRLIRLIPLLFSF